MRPTLILTVLFIALSLTLTSCKGKSADTDNRAESISTAQTETPVGYQAPADPASTDPDTPVSGPETPVTDAEQPSTTPENPASAPTDLPEGWRDDIPYMPGFTIRTFDAGPGSMVALMEGNVPIEDVTTFYSSIPGWEKDPNREWRTSGTRRSLTYINDEWKLTVTINRSGEKTSLTIMVVG